MLLLSILPWFSILPWLLSAFIHRSEGFTSSDRYWTTTNRRRTLIFLTASSDQIDRNMVETQLGYLPTNYVRVSARTNKSSEPIAIQTYPLQGGSARRQAKASKSKNPSQLGTPFPTLYWFTHPRIGSAIAELERQGYVKRIQQESIGNGWWDKQWRECHLDYAHVRWSSLSHEHRSLLMENSSDDDQHSSAWMRMRQMLESSGVAGADLITTEQPSIKCLHAHYAHFRSQLDGIDDESAADPHVREDNKTVRHLNLVGRRVHELLKEQFPDLEL